MSKPDSHLRFDPIFCSLRWDPGGKQFGSQYRSPLFFDRATAIEEFEELGVEITPRVLRDTEARGGARGRFQFVGHPFCKAIGTN